MADLRIDVAAEFKGKKAFKEADKATGSLDKAVGKLGKQLAAVFATTKIIAFGKASVKAFIADEKAATKLTTAVKNLGLSFAQTQIDSFISKLESTSRVADDLLRPAFQALLTTTGSLTKSQELLNLAIETSRGSGIELQTVTQDLANAYVGNTRGLRKYNLGLSVAALKAASFEEVQARLNKQFTGASASYLTTYAGKFEALQLAAGNAQETIGKGLVDAIALIGGKGVSDIQNATDAMDDFASSTANVIRGQGVVISNLAKLGGGTGGKIGNLVKTYFKEVLGIQALEDLGKASQPRPRAGRFFRGGQQANLYSAEAAASKKLADQQKKLAADQLKSSKALTAEQKKQTSLKKSQGVFDLDQIQIVAALKGKLSEDDKIRLQAQLALLNGNADLAAKLTAEILAAQDSTGNLARFLSTLPNAKNPFEYLDAYLSYLAGKAAAVLTGTTAPNVPSTTASAAAMPTPSEMAASGSFSQLVSQGAGASGGFSPVVAAAMAQPVVVELKITGDGDLTNSIAKNLMQQSLSTGNQTYVNRRTGGFE
jgi:hypothetical protein